MACRAVCRLPSRRWWRWNNGAALSTPFTDSRDRACTAWPTGSSSNRSRLFSQSFVCGRNNFSSAVNVGKGVRDDPITDRKLSNDEVPVQQSGSSTGSSSTGNSGSTSTAGSSSTSNSSATGGSSRNALDDTSSTGRRPRRENWWADADDFGFDSMLGPFRSFVPRPIRQSLKQMQRWMNRDAPPRIQGHGQGQGQDAEEQLSHSVRDMIYDFDAELLKPVSLTLDEHEGEYVAKIYLKGFQKSDLNLRIQDDYLIVNGSVTNEEFKDRKDSGKMQHYSSQSFSRVLNLPDDVERNNIHAKFENSQLIIQMPKDKKKKHVIEIH